MTQLTEQIRQQLVTDILEGRYVPGSAFPTELETAERFRVSRVTVRRAYGALEEAGIIVRRRRVGTVVNDRFAAATGPIRVLGAILPLNDSFSRDFLKTICAEASRA
ncbi:winged helix-turn-helix domain-containing protein [Victivallis vadensis]|uniref:winged helix-turn-helix domain-containing protein n=1 Tax=Victivallis vadensis TaxID=172901 RepID=UPI003D04D504